jgi:predicted nucleotidyltransferase
MNSTKRPRTAGQAPASVDDSILAVLANHPEIRIAILFGSLARGSARSDSDLDLAVAAAAPLSASQRTSLVAALAQHVGRPVDLVDLRKAAGVVLREALTRGRRLRMSDASLLAGLLRRLWLDEADFHPYRRRILEVRRKAWIGR